MNLLLAANFLSSLAAFLSLPVVSLYLQDHFALPPARIGAIGAIWPGTVFLSSFFCGSIIDRLGYRMSIRLGLGFCVSGFLVAFFAGHVAFFAIAMVIFGLGKSFFDSSIRTAIAGICPEERRARTFRTRYLILNVASVLGPLVGAFLFPVFSGNIFIFTAAVYGIALILASTMPRDTSVNINIPKSWIPKSGHRLLLNDPSLLLWVISGTLVVTVYGAFEAIMPLVAGHTASNVPIFGYLMSINSGIVIVMQFLQLIPKGSESKFPIATLGFIGLTLGFSVFAWESGTFSWLILGTVLYSLGESLVFPCYDIQLDKISTEAQKASYFAVGEVKQVGFFLGSFLGGILYQFGGATGLFTFSAILCVLSFVAFKACGRRHVRQLGLRFS